MGHRALTRAKVQGKTEYMPAARSLYETALSAEMTGWMTVALMMLKKSVVAYRAPSTFTSPPCVLLQTTHPCSTCQSSAVCLSRRMAEAH